MTMQKECDEFSRGQEGVRAALEDLADQLGAVVDGNFNSSVQTAVRDASTDRFQTLVKLVLDTARRSLAESQLIRP